MELSSSKKFLLGFGGVVVVSFVLLAVQIKKSFSITTSHIDAPLIALEAIDIPIDQAEPLLGNPGAPITLVAYLDFGNQKNRALYTILVDSVRKHPGDFRLIFKHAPYSSFWFESTHATVHTAILCASQQKKLWGYTDQLAQIPTLWRQKQLIGAATSANLNIELFSECTGSATIKTQLADLIAASKLLAPNPPTLFVNNKQINLDSDIDIEQLLLSFIE